MASWRTTCELEGISLEAHFKCRLCAFLVGPSHLTQELDKEGVCEQCQPMQEIRAAQQWPLIDDDIYKYKEVQEWLKRRILT